MPDFTNETIDLDQLPKYQEVVLTQPHRSYWNIILINLFIFLFIVAIGLALLLVLNPDAKAYIYLIVGGFLTLGLLLFFLYKVSFKKRGFALREKDIIYKSGVIAEKTSIIPLNRIQHVTLNEGVFSRMYKLATLKVNTAGDSSGHMHIAGIPIEKAKAIKEALLKRIDILENTATD